MTIKALPLCEVDYNRLWNNTVWWEMEWGAAPKVGDRIAAWCGEKEDEHFVLLATVTEVTVFPPTADEVLAGYACVKVEWTHE